MMTADSTFASVGALLGRRKGRGGFDRVYDVDLDLGLRLRSAVFLVDSVF